MYFGRIMISSQRGTSTASAWLNWKI